MPGQARIDAPGAPHPIIGRSIDRQEFFSAGWRNCSIRPRPPSATQFKEATHWLRKMDMNCCGDNISDADVGPRIGLEQGRARAHCLALMQTLEKNGRLDFDVPEHAADPRLSLQYLWSEARGQMFGVLECLGPDGQPVILKAFSGQYNSVWQVDGWVPPLFDPEKFRSLVGGVDHRIKALGARIDGLPGGLERQELTRRRKQLSQHLMKEIHALYRVHNFRSEVRPLFDFFPNGIPAGAGDCCAPKLLNAAAGQHLRPMSLAEIFWGRTNRSKTRRQGTFYTACAEKCRPVLGFMLRGIER